MTKMKKLGALLLALVLALSLSVPAFAEANTGKSDFDGNTGHPYAQQEDATFSIKKEIVLFNVEGESIFDPNVVYTYTVSPVNVTDGTPKVTGIILNDNHNPHEVTTALVKDGVANSVTIQGRKVDQYENTTASANHAVTGASGATTTLTFGGDNGTKTAPLTEGDAITTSSAGGANNKVSVGYIDVTVDETAFTTPGIYRYKISDTTQAATLTAAGITRDANYVTDLYLDIYVKNNSTNTGMEVYGYVLFKEGSPTRADQIIEYGSAVTSETIKVEGYTVLSEVTTADQYHTYNVEVTKTITGALADKHNNFPFRVDLSNANVTSQADFYYVVTTDGQAAAAVTDHLSNAGAWGLGDVTTTPANSALKFEDGDGITIYGLPVSTKIAVAEYNNTPDVYSASAKDEADAALNLDSNNSTPDNDVASVALESTKKASLHASKDVDSTTANDEVEVTNNIETVSPTGVVLRTAPYALMFGFGILFLAVIRRRREEEEEPSMA